jgi:hypothetical protein
MIKDLPAAESSILKHAYADAIKTIWAVMCGLAGAALIATIFIKEYTLDQEHFGEQGYVDPKKSKVLVTQHADEAVLASANESEKPQPSNI